MRVITEERLKEIAKQYGESSISESIIFGILVHEFQEFEQIMVSKLRAMSECGVGWFIKHVNSQELEICTAINNTGQICSSATGIYFVIRAPLKIHFIK